MTEKEKSPQITEGESFCIKDLPCFTGKAHDESFRVKPILVRCDPRMHAEAESASVRETAMSVKQALSFRLSGHAQGREKNDADNDPHRASHRV